MKDFLLNSLYFGLTVSVGTYFIGMKLKKRFKLAIFNPLLVSAVLTVIILSVFKIDFQTYNESAKYITYLLTPTTVCLAVPLYEQLELLKKNLFAVLISIFAGVMTSAVSILLMCILFKMDKTWYITLLPKSITCAMGIGVSGELGGIETITVAAIVFTGIFGNIAADFILKLFRVKNPIAKGLALGTSAHAIGTSKALEYGETEGAMSRLAIAAAGLMTVVVASVFVMFY